MIRILVFGQIPTPYGGQAITIKLMLDGRYSGIELYHVRMVFAKEMNEMGKFKLHKIYSLFTVITKAIYYRIFKNVKVLYYPVSGPDKFPVLRDIAILLPIRWMFSKTIYHFHAAGISEIYPELPRFIRWFFDLTFQYPDLAIKTSEFNPEDGKFLMAKQNVVVPNGVADSYQRISEQCCRTPDICKILFVGLIKRTKGVTVLLEAARILARNKLSFKVNIMGQFESESYANECKEFIKQNAIEHCVEFLGVQTGDIKFRTFYLSDIFCFPSYFESESFGNVLVEAMQFRLPTVATKWRGIQSIVEDGKSGYLVPIKDSNSVASKLELLI
jgi:glycosyltransferase involved in cell wall biosynthesis